MTPSAILPLDVDGDGAPTWSRELVAKRIAWSQSGPDRRVVAEAAGGQRLLREFAILADLGNDGRAREVLPQFGDPKARWPGTKRRTGVGEARRRAGSFGHGIGAAM